MRLRYTVDSKFMRHPRGVDQKLEQPHSAAQEQVWRYSVILQVHMLAWPTGMKEIFLAVLDRCHASCATAFPPFHASVSLCDTGASRIDYAMAGGIELTTALGLPRDTTGNLARYRTWMCLAGGPLRRYANSVRR